MEKHSKKTCIYADKFHEMLSDPNLFGSVASFEKAFHACRYKLKSRKLSGIDRMKMSLALAWARMVRINLQNSSQARSILDKIAVDKNSGDKLLKHEYAIVDATYSLLVENDYLRARATLEEQAAMLRRSESNFLYALVSRSLSILHIWTGNYVCAEEYAQDAISIFRRFGHKFLLASSINNYAVIKKILCQYEEAERLLKQALKIFRSLGAEDGEFICLMNLGIIKIKSGDWNAARDYYAQVERLENELNIKNENLLSYRVNVAHLDLLQRKFTHAQRTFIKLANEFGGSKALRQKALSHEFLGELYTEIGDYEVASLHLEKAARIAERIAPEGDLMTEVKRRRATLHLLRGNLQEAGDEAMSCLKLCKKINDKHELGAALRVFGEIYAEKGRAKKAAGAFSASVRILESIHECYELMRSNLAFGEFLRKERDRSADAYLLEAKNLCGKLNIGYYSSRIMIALGRHAIALGKFAEARACLRKSEMVFASLHGPDRKKLKRDIKLFYSELDQAILKSSTNSAGMLKELGRIYEKTRFPIVELCPELATRVARTVGAESLFLIKKRGKGYRVPIKYNIAADNAKRIVKSIERAKGGRLFSSKSPGVYDLGGGKKLVSVSEQENNGYVLCSLLPGTQNLSPKEIEFLIASFDAMQKLAEEKLSVKASIKRRSFDGAGTHPLGNFSGIITMDPQMIRLIRLAERASETDVPILLEGETGVGKELFAKAMHANSPRREAAFVTINTGGIPSNFLESELFGYVKGAFTDARADKLGLVQEAWRGTLFLDEVGDMNEETQVKLLRIIENGEYRRLGENKLRRTDIRIISATNKDLQTLVEKGRFREDLYYRLSTVRFVIPALRFRKGDIELLIRHLLRKCLEKLRKEERTITMDENALEALKLYDWPGNVRELQNEIMRLVSLIGDEDVIRFGMLSDRIRDYFNDHKLTGVFERNVESFERRLILEALEENDWNRLRTAEQMGIPRTTLMAKMRKLNIT